jgi:hypothetical protein
MKASPSQTYNSGSTHYEARLKSGFFKPEQSFDKERANRRVSDS